MLFIYAHWIEPNWIDVSHHRVKIKHSKSLRLAHLSDLHIRSLGFREARILSILEKEKPDAILITGDSVAENANYLAVSIFLKQMHAPLGVWLVKGNWEHWRSNDNDEYLLESVGVELLNNSAKKLQDNIWLVGLDDETAGQPNLTQALRDVPAGALTLGMFHSPAFFDQVDQRFDLILAGHTHGGQVRLPFFPPFWLPEGSGRFVEGWYGNQVLRMFVSRGLGNSILDIRLFCRPELAIIDLVEDI